MSRLLIIEDELPMRTALKDCLEAEGYRVLTAADGESGLTRALEEKPDLILLDIMMPRLDGFAVCAELRRLNNPVPILMLTANGQDWKKAAPPDRQRICHAPAARRGRRRTGLAGAVSRYRLGLHRLSHHPH